MGILHAKSNPIPDYTGTVTVHNSTGGTTTVAAGNLVRPSDWNSEHNEFRTIVGNFDPTMNTTASGTNLVYAGGDGLRLGGSNNTVLWEIIPRSKFQHPPSWASISHSVATNNSVSVNYVECSNVVSGSRVDVYYSVSGNTHTSASTNTMGLTIHFGFYTLDGNTLGMATSGSATYSTTWSTNATASINGVREFSVPMNALLTQGRYWVGMRASTSSSNASMGMSVLFGANMATLHMNPQVLGASVTTTRYLYPGLGILATTSSDLPVTINMAGISGSGTIGSRANFFFQLNNVEI